MLSVALHENVLDIFGVAVPEAGEISETDATGVIKVKYTKVLFRFPKESFAYRRRILLPSTAVMLVFAQDVKV